MMRALPFLILGPLWSAVGCGDASLSALDRDEYFAQSDTAVTADVLWIMDNSGTMLEEQALVLEAAAPFVDALQAGEADFHLGVTTTDTSDPDRAGRLEGGTEQPFLTAQDTDLLASFLERLDVGVDGDRIERGLQAVQRAIYLGEQGLGNIGFFRPEAKLHLVFVSDEDDQSAPDVGSFLETYKETAPEGVVASALVGDLPAGCLANAAAADAGPRYIDLAQRTGGFTGSICQDDYGPLVEAVGLRVLEMQRAFALEYPAAPETVQVWVDSVEMPQRVHNGWDFDPGDNTVRFSGWAVPGPGQEVHVHYRIAAGSVAEN